MIITGIFLLLLGTNLGQAATKTEVKYEGPDMITVIEQKDDQIVVPGLGPPPFAPSFFHQGSNFFFNPQLVLPGGIIPTGIDTVIAPIQPPTECNDILAPQMITDVIIEREPIVDVIVPEPPSFEIEETIQPLPQFQVEIERLPIEIPVSPKLTLSNPPVQVLVKEPSNIPIPCDDVEIGNIISRGPFSVEIPNLPLFIEERIEPSDLIVSEVDVHINTVPQPPELPKLIVTEIPKPVNVQETYPIPCDDVEISNIISRRPISVEMPNVPLFIEEHIEPSDLIVSEVDVHINTVPQPPELPKLIVTEIPKPVTVQETYPIPCDDVEISNIISRRPFSVEMPNVPLFIEEHIEPSDLIVSEVDVHINTVPQPPGLPKLIVTEIPKPINVQEKYQITCDDVEIGNIISRGPFSVEIPNVPLFIEERIEPSDLIISEVDVRINKIPQPPELPKLIVSEILGPVNVQENKRVIFVPSVPELASFYLPPETVTEKTLNPMDCAQNIIFERVLPNIAFEDGKTVELISIRATKRPPAVSSYFL